MSAKNQGLYWQLQGAECAAALERVCNRLEELNEPRYTRARRNLGVFENKAMTSLAPEAYYNLSEASGDGYDYQRINVVRAIASSAVARVGGKQRPKAQFVVNSDDWSVKRRAKRMERVVEAIELQRQANHHDAWSVGLMALRDSAVLDSGFIKWDIDWLSRKITCQRVLPWEVMVDPAEAQYGAPRNLFHVYGMDRWLLVAQYPEFEDEILKAPVFDSKHQTTSATSANDSDRFVKVREAWRLPVGRKHEDGYQAGRHVIAVGGVDLAQGEEWDCDFFPFEVMTWEPWFTGIHGTSIVDIVLPIHDEINAATERWANAEKLGSNQLIFVREGAIKDEEITSNIPCTIVHVPIGSDIPVTIAPETIGQASMAWRQMLKGEAYEISGQSQSAAAGTVENGITAAVAMRQHDSISTERFSWQWRMFESVMAIGSARQIIARLRQIADTEGDDFTVRWPGGKYLQEIKWSDADLEDEQFQIQVYAVSGLTNTPTDRLNLASDLFDKGVISKDSFLRVLQFKNVDEEIGAQNRQSELLERMIEEWLDADVDKLEGQDPEYIQRIYWPPEPFLNLTEAMVQVGRAYFAARLERAPDAILELFTRYMSELDAQIQKQQAIQAQLQAANNPPPTPGA